MNSKSKQKSLRISIEHPIQKRILELAESGKPVMLKDGRYSIGNDFLRELLILGYQQVVDPDIFQNPQQKNRILENKIEEMKKLETLDSMTEPI